MELKKLTLENFAKGAAGELFERELQQVLENIDDPNTKAEANREISLKFTIRPDAEKEEAELFIEAKSKLAPVKIAKGQTYFGKRNGKLTAYSHNIHQMEMDTEQKPALVEQETVNA